MDGMMETAPAAVILLVASLAFAVGFAVRRGNICAVRAAEQLVERRRARRLLSFATAACWSGLVVLPLVWFAPGIATLSPGYAATPVVLIGGMVFGVGALLNGACALGTVARLSGGDATWFGTVLGAVLGAVAARALAPPANAPEPSFLLESPMAAAASFGLFLAVAATSGIRHLRRRGAPATASARPWRPMTAIFVLGVAGGLLNAMAGDWTYMALLSSRAAALVGPAMGGGAEPAFAAAAALLAGGVAAARLSGDFAPKVPRAGPLLRRLAGGGLMGFGAAITPGGNDVLLLSGLPALAPHAFAAYAAMLATLLALLAVGRAVRR